MGRIIAVFLFAYAMFGGLYVGSRISSENAYRSGYAAAVDSVRKDQSAKEYARLLNLYEVPYDMVIWNRYRTDTVSVIRVGGAR